MFVGMYYICSRDFRYHGVIGRFGNGNHCIKFHSFLVMEYQRGRVFNYYEKIPFLDRNVFGKRLWRVCINVIIIVIGSQCGKF